MIRIFFMPYVSNAFSDIIYWIFDFSPSFYFYGIINHSLLFFIQIFILFIHLVSRKDVYEGGIGSSEIPFSPYIYALYETIFR